MCKETCFKITCKNSQNFWEHLQFVKQCSYFKYHEERGEGTVFYDPRRCGTGQIGRLTSRVHITSRQRIFQSERMDPREHEDRSSSGQSRHGIENMIESILGDGTCSWVMIVHGINKYVTEMTEETQEDHIDYIGECTRKPVAKHDNFFFNDTLPYIICVFGLTWNQVRTTRVVSKCKKCSGCFDSILQYSERKTEHSNSECWHRCFVQNLRILSFDHFEHGWIICKKMT